MAMYVPSYNNNNCVVLSNMDTIRVYDSRPCNGCTINYKDYYIHSDYYYNIGTATFSQYSTLPACRTDITTDYWYRVDIDKILICVFILCIMIGYFALKPFQRLMGRWLKL